MSLIGSLKPFSFGFNHLAISFEKRTFTNWLFKAEEDWETVLLRATDFNCDDSSKTKNTLLGAKCGNIFAAPIMCAKSDQETFVIFPQKNKILIPI